MFDSLQIQKPLNLNSPPSIVCGNTISTKFEKKMESFRVASRKARSSRRSAEGLSTLVQSVMTEVQTSLEEGEETLEENFK